jgi:ATP-binding cassette, subfamily B, bacterial PglK
MFKVIRQSLSLLTLVERRKIAALAFLQLVGSFLDLIGLALVGLIAGVSLEQSLNGRFTKLTASFLSNVHLTLTTWESILGLIILSALLTLLSKSLISVYLTRAVYENLAKAQARIAEESFDKILKAPYLWVKSLNSQEATYALTDGLMLLVIGVLGSFIVGLIESFSLFMVVIGLLVLNPGMAISATIFFLVLAISINSILGSRVRSYGEKYTEDATSSRAAVNDAIMLYREMRLAGHGSLFRSKFTSSRYRASSAFARLYWLQQVPKYIMELGIILGASLLVLMVWITSSTSQGIPTLAIFIMAATRVVPSILRLQAVHLALKEYSGKSEKAFSLIQNSFNPVNPHLTQAVNTNVAPSTPPRIEFSNVAFSYDRSKPNTINQVNLVIEAGEEMILVGPSGSGKSTICEIALGLLTPSSGTVTYNDTSALEWISNSNSRAAYLPQDPHYFAGTVRENITLGKDLSSNSENEIWEALEIARIAEFVKELPNGLETLIGERGTQLSGGQRQRIGIARTLYGKPLFVVIDEGTSALDQETESALIEMLTKLRGFSTIIRVTHRITKFSESQQVAYIESGELKNVQQFGTTDFGDFNFDLSNKVDDLE